MKPKNVLGFRWSAAVDTKKRNYKKIDADWNVDPEWLCAALNGIGLIIKRDVQTNNIPRELDLCKKYCMDLFNREYYWKRTGLKPSFETMDERKLMV